MPVMPSDFSLPGHVISGHGSIARLLTEVSAFGKRGVLVFGKSFSNQAARLLADAPQGLTVKTWLHPGGEPLLEHAELLRKYIVENQADWVAAVGGGSVMDAAKAAAGLCRAKREAAYYHDGGKIEQPGAPFLAAPTTAGTGSEATINAVLTNPKTGQKKSIRDDSLMARIVVLDPGLMAELPREVIANTGLDAITQALEGFTSRFAAWYSDQFCLQALRLLSANLEGFYTDPSGGHAEPMLQGSFLAGIGFSISRLGVAHGLAHPLGVRLHAQHGLVCGVCLPLAIKFNKEAMGEKYKQASLAVGSDIFEYVSGVLQRFGIKSPFAGKTLPDKEGIIAETLASGSTKANPREVTAKDVEWFMDQLEAGKT